MDIFHQSTFTDINREDTKLRTCELFKCEIGREQYLQLVKHTGDRNSLTRLRLSSHSLMIERGRHLGILKDLRFCPFCPEHIEDEIHFLIKCKCYNAVRKTFFESEIKSKLPKNFSRKSEKQKFIILMTDMRMISHTAKLIRKLFSIRELIVF